MIWFYLALGSVIGAAIANIYRRIVMQQDTADAFTSAIVFQFFGTIIVGAFALWHGIIIPPFTRYPINFLIQAIFWSGATVSLFTASRYLEASEATLLSTFITIVTIVSAIFFLHEHFSSIYGIGAVFIMVSVIIISLRPGKMTMNKGVFYILLYCLLAGLASTNDAFLLRYSDPLSYLLTGFFTEGIVLILFRPNILLQIPKIVRSPSLRNMFFLSLFYAIGAILYFLALHYGGNVSQVSPINQSSIILTIVLSAIILREKEHVLKKVICMMLVTIGVLLLH